MSEVPRFTKCFLPNFNFWLMLMGRVQKSVNTNIHTSVQWSLMG